MGFETLAGALQSPAYISPGLSMPAPPMMGGVEECRRVLDCMKYATDGARGVALRIAHDNYRAVDALGAAAFKHGRALGYVALSIEESVILARQGFGMICYSGDVWLLGAAVRSGIESIRVEVAS